MRKSGFSLLELMTVMVIMFILMGMATMALRGVVRGAGISGALAGTRAVLTQARQQAIVHQRPTAVVFRQQDDLNSMTVVTRYGRAALPHQSYLLVESDLPWTAIELYGTRMYNMNNGVSGVLSGSADDTDPNSRRAFISSIPWQAGNEVAFMVGDERYLPGSIEFGQLPNPPLVVFNADGTVRTEPEFILLLVEKSMQGATNNAIRLRVQPTTGWVEVL